MIAGKAETRNFKAMNKEKARQVLTQSISNLEKRKGGVTQGDINAEVINNACLAIVKNQNEKISNGKSFRDMLVGALNSTQDFHTISMSFINAARELLPDYFEEEDARDVLIGIEQNLAWEGLWDFLTDYFRKNHGIIIEEGETVPLVFFCSRETRYEDGILVSDSEVDKTIYINFTSGKKKVIITIEPDYPPQKGIFYSREDKILKFRDHETDSLYTIVFDDYDEVESLTLVQENMEVVFME